MELTENGIMNIRNVTDIGGLLKYFRDRLNWNIDVDSFEDIEDVMYGFSASDLGLKEEEFAKVESLYQLPPLGDEQQWGIFCVEFNTEKFSVTALRKILSRLVPTRHNATMHTVWDETDLLFLCFWGTGDNRTICVAHFEQQANALSQVRTIHCSPAVEDPAVLAHFEKRLGSLQWPIDPSDYEKWHNSWAAAFDTYWGEVIRTSAALAEHMAKVAKDIKDRILEAMRVETANGFIHLLFDKVKKKLVHDLNESEFADMYAQTIVYGLFSARCLDKTPEDFSVDKAISLIPNTNPFLKNMMRDCCAVKQGGGVSFDELGIADVVDMFAKLDAAVIAENFGRRTGGGREDPVIYFYEKFLEAYDENQRVERGVFYTPVPVVNFMVRAVDYILRTQFNMPDGLATEATKTIKVVPEGKKIAVKKEVPAIQILDPALGTGTFLREIILNIYETFKKNYDVSGRTRTTAAPHTTASAFIEAWSRYVDRNILPRLNGFELMMTPYAIAHMKLAMVLQDTGYNFKGKGRLQVYLTNSLEEPGDSSGQLMLFEVDPLAAESIEANKVKKNSGINIVIGNPPYSGESLNKGAWIMKLMKDYKKEPGGKEKLNEKNPKWINNDYVKFMRLAQQFIIRSGKGVLAYINPNGFIDNPTFRGMRWQLMQTFDEIYVLNLHGSENENCPDGSKDENVFDIKQGVSINILVKNNNSGVTKCAVYYADLWGLRKKKYVVLEKSEIGTIKWQLAEPKDQMFFFLPKNNDGNDKYTSGFSVNEMLTENSVGVVTGKDDVLVGFTNSELKHNIMTAYGETPENDLISPFLHGIFDKRAIYYDLKKIARARHTIMSHFRGQGDNMGLIVKRGFPREDTAPVFASDEMSNFRYWSRSGMQGGDYVFPLYLYQEDYGKIQKVPNLNPEIVKKITAELGEEPAPEEIFYYIYAVLHSPSYREKYKEFLKIDFPRIPYPTDASVFHALAGLGAQLVAIHIMKDFNEADDVAFDDEGGREIIKVAWKDDSVYINKVSRFMGIDQATCNQYIGGYQPLLKWLKGRKGRTLSDDDISHYKRIVRALRRTAELMTEIDKVFTP